MHHFRKTCTILEKHASFSLGGRKERFKHLRVSLFDIRHWKLTIKNSSYSMSFVIQKSMRAFAHGTDWRSVLLRQKLFGESCARTKTSQFSDGLFVVLLLRGQNVVAKIEVPTIKKWELNSTWTTVPTILKNHQRTPLIFLRSAVLKTKMASYPNPPTVPNQARHFFGVRSQYSQSCQK